VRNDRCGAVCSAHFGARLTRRMTSAGAVAVLALAISAFAPRAAFAQTPLPPATFYLSLEVLGGYGGGESSPGDKTINYCDPAGYCGGASGSLSADISKNQSISGFANTSQDLGSQGDVTIDYYYRFDGPAGGTVDYHFSSSGATSEVKHGSARAFLYVNGTLVNYACSSSLTGYCAVSDEFEVNTEFSAKAGATEKIEIDLDGDTGAFGGGFTAAIDPTITIDPSSVAEGYSLELSPNVTQGSPAPSVPEPATWVMALTGFAALGFAYRVRRRAPAVLRRG
jgi:PEP-CTERM motif